MKQMSKLITILFVFFLPSPSWCETFTIDDLVKRDGLYYEKFTDVPFTGNISGKTKGKIENGKADGSWRDYYTNGQLFSKGNYKNGKRGGPWFIYFESGQLKTEGNYKNGKKDGPWFINYESGWLKTEGNCKNGEMDGRWSEYGDGAFRYESFTPYPTLYNCH